MANHQARGKEIREQLTDELYRSGRSRPLQQTMDYNAYGQVYILRRATTSITIDNYKANGQVFFTRSQSNCYYLTRLLLHFVIALDYS